MKILVVGCGSIGKRHIRNLKALSVRDIIAHDVQPERCHEVEREYGIKAYNDLKDALAQKPDAVLICTPTSLHIPPALSAAQNGCHLFIEKPLSHTLDGVDELLETVAQKNLITMVGCNMRFHPGPKKVKEIINSGLIGRLFSARIQTASYLPDWRPLQNYKESYSAREDLGGGCVLDCIHEIDLARWYLGDVKSVYSITKNMGVIDIETEEISEIVCEFRSGVIGSIHLDYISRTYERNNHIIGEKGAIFWDYRKGTVEVYLADEDKWEVYHQPLNYDTNQMFVDGLSYFISCMENNQNTFNDIEEATKALKFALAIKESSKINMSIKIGGYK